MLTQPHAVQVDARDCGRALKVDEDLLAPVGRAERKVGPVPGGFAGLHVRLGVPRVRQGDGLPLAVVKVRLLQTAPVWVGGEAPTCVQGASLAGGGGRSVGCLSKSGQRQEGAQAEQDRAQ